MRNIIHSFPVKRNTVNKVSVTFKNKSQKDCVIIITDDKGSVISRRNVNGDRDTYHSVFNFTGASY